MEGTTRELRFYFNIFDLSQYRKYSSLPKVMRFFVRHTVVPHKVGGTYRIYFYNILADVESFRLRYKMHFKLFSALPYALISGSECRCVNIPTVFEEEVCHNDEGLQSRLFS